MPPGGPLGGKGGAPWRDVITRSQLTHEVNSPKLAGGPFIPGGILFGRNGGPPGGIMGGNPGPGGNGGRALDALVWTCWLGREEEDAYGRRNLGEA